MPMTTVGMQWQSGNVCEGVGYRTGGRACFEEGKDLQNGGVKRRTGADKNKHGQIRNNDGQELTTGEAVQQLAQTNEAGKMLMGRGRDGDGTRARGGAAGE
jgi:hypothetical protein